MAASSKTFIVRSVLDPAIIERAARVDPQILACERKGLPDINRDEDEDEDVADGAIIAWKKADQLAAFGTLQVVLSLILVSGRAIHDRQCSASLSLRWPDFFFFQNNSAHSSKPYGFQLALPFL